MVMGCVLQEAQRKTRTGFTLKKWQILKKNLIHILHAGYEYQTITEQFLFSLLTQNEAKCGGKYLQHSFYFKMKSVK